MNGLTTGAALALFWAGALSAGQTVLSENFEQAQAGPYGNAELSDDWSGVVSAGLFDRSSVVEDSEQGMTLRVNYPKGGVGPRETGGQFEISIPGAEEYILSYKIKFEQGFDFRLGGKLPGLTSGGGKYTGGIHPENGEGWSARFMWRDGGTAEIYLYYIDNKEDWGEQLPLEGVVFQPGQWIELKQRIRINSPDGKDALIQAWVDGRLVMEKSDFRLRLGDQGEIDSLYFSTFHGGNSEEWAPLNDSHVQFDDFHIQPHE